MLESVIRRAEKLNEWLKKSGVKKEQAHLVKDSREKLYWHYGYYVALIDVLTLLNKKIIIEDSQQQDKYN